METITQLPQVLQALFTSTADQEEKATGFIQRERKLSGGQFLQSMVFGYLQHPRATRRELYQALCCTGVTMSAQGFEARIGPSALRFLKRMVEHSLKVSFETEPLLPLLSRFKGVYLSDSTRIEAEVTPLKIGTRLELQGGSLQLSLEMLETHDNQIQVMAQDLPVGALHVGDLGFFDLERFAHWASQGVEWLTRYKVGTCLYQENGQAIDLVKDLRYRRQPLTRVVLVGKQERLAMYLHAQRLPEKDYQQRLRLLKKEARRKQQPLSANRKALSRWTLYLTSLQHLTFDQVQVLMRARWQIERLFKRWKSLGKLTFVNTRDPIRRSCALYAKLLAVILAHWFSQTYAWPHSALSRDALFIFIQQHARLFYYAYFHLPPLQLLLLHLFDALFPSLTLSRRKSHPNAADLWARFDALP